MKTTVIKALLAMLCAMVIPGCSDKSGPSQTTGKADSPQQALENMRSALLAGGSKEAFLDCFETSGKQEDMLVAFYEFTVVTKQFDQAMRKAYGEEAVKEAMGDRNQGSQLDDENWLEDVEIQVDGSHKVGQTGYTAEKINQELGKAMMIAMMKAAGTPTLPSASAVPSQ